MHCHLIESLRMHVHVYVLHIVHRLEFLDNLDIVSMFSSEGEKVQMTNAISTSAARGAVEKWLLQVQDTMIVSIRDITEKARDVSSYHAVCKAYVCTSCSIRLSKHCF